MRMVDSPADVLRKARKAKGFATAADAARSFGWNEATYTSHENGTRGIRLMAARRYSRAFNIPLSGLIGVESERLTNRIVETESVRVIGKAALGIWRDSALDNNNISQGIQYLSIPAGDAMRQAAVEVADESVNRLIAAGEFAIIGPISETELALLDTGYLYVERARGTLIERTIRRAQKRKADRLELSTYSTEPRFSEVITYPSSRPDETVKILGRVTGKYQAFDIR